jgi:2-(1,2-epoxy-1,2-dihydrophenyl)acetyl-CoA isomerase
MLIVGHALSAKRPYQECGNDDQGTGHDPVVTRALDPFAVRIESHSTSIVGVMETLEVLRAEGVVTVTMNRPSKKNAANATMWQELLEVFGQIGDTDSDRVVVLTGAGSEFCSGADLSDGSPRRADRHQLTFMRHISDVCLALARIPQPTIAKVRGVAVGAGCNMALICDLVVASETARFSEIFSKRGLSLDFGGSWVLPRRIGLHRAKELAFFAEIIGATEAERIGLVNRVLPDAELDAFVDNWAKRLAVGPPIALAQSKRLLNNSANVTLEQALDDEGAAQTVNFGTKDTLEAMSAFAEKREPRFTGR